MYERGKALVEIAHPDLRAELKAQVDKNLGPEL
jgi:acyl-CoA hydrolase